MPGPRLSILPLESCIHPTTPRRRHARAVARSAATADQRYSVRSFSPSLTLARSLAHLLLRARWSSRRSCFKPTLFILNRFDIYMESYKDITRISLDMLHRIVLFFLPHLYRCLMSALLTWSVDHCTVFLRSFFVASSSVI